ncbi:unnamed protein product [Lactuca virosa]|uniref:Uncharacterized protein n=1 Tax=Lactuca virosa TaxID=75947 RepID=A0AAU9PAU8_9ASTR|nr:unnamed protein product [Lactuca virosa]
MESSRSCVANVGKLLQLGEIGEHMRRTAGSFGTAFVVRILSTKDHSKITLKLLATDMQLMVSMDLKKMMNPHQKSSKMMMRIYDPR